MTDPLRYELDDRVAVLRFDDGKANVLSHAAIDAFHAALDRAEGEAGAVALIGRPERFCAGFDLAVMRGGPDGVKALVKAGAQLCLRLYTAPLPVVVGCTGHALAAGGIMLMSCDTRIGADGSFKIGMPEVAMGMPLPVFAVELARDRLSRRHLQAATLQGRVYDPATALDAGYLDEVVAPEQVEGRTLAEAAQLAGTLHPQAFAQTRDRVRGATAELIRSTLDTDIESFFVAEEATS